MPHDLPPEEIERSHRWHAVECLAWQLSDEPTRTPAQEEEMLDAAHAAGEKDLHRRHYAMAKEIGNAIADPEDKGIFLKTFEGIPVG